MLSVALMLEVARRTPAEVSRPLLDDACAQASYNLDAPDQVQDGAEWFEDEEIDCRGAVPRFIWIRDLPW